MIALLDLQHAMRRGLLGPDDRVATRHIVAAGIAPAARLDIYRNGIIGGLTTALRLSFPAVFRLVGTAFFETAARIFIDAEPPDCAWLDAYGARFPDFLAHFEPAASLPYLPGVARLEWAINRALHAPDVAAMDIAALSGIDPDGYGQVAFIPHPSVSLVEADHPVDTIWRAVLDADDAGLGAIDPDSGSVRLLIQRGHDGIVATRCDAAAWRFAADLIASRALDLAFDGMPEHDATILLADHLAAGRFIGFTLVTALETLSK